MVMDKGKVAVTIEAKDKASPIVKGVGGKLQGLSQQARKMGMAFTVAGGAIVGAMALSVKSFAEAGDEVQKMALRTGISTEALSELKHAAELGGSSLDDVEKAVKKMSKTVVDAESGLATYVRAFDRIGLSAEDLIDLDPEEQFNKVAMAIAGMENPTLRAATAQEIFGRAGTQLLPMLSEGAEGLDRLRQEARDLGIVFDQEAANKAANLNDAMTRLKGGVNGLKMGIAETLIPALMPLIEKFIEVGKTIRQWTEEHPALAKVITIVVAAVGALLLVLGPLLMLLPGLVALAPLVGAAFTIMLGPIGLIILAIAGLIAIGVLLWKNWDTIKKKAVTVWNSITSFFKKIWTTIKQIFTEHWDKILAILFPAIGLPILVARNWGTIKEKVQQIWNSVTNIVGNWWDSIKAFLAKMNPWHWIKEGWEKLREGISGVLSNVFGGSDVENWTGKLKSYLAGVDLSPAGSQMFDTFRAGVNGKLDETLNMTKSRLTQLKAAITGTTGAEREAAILGYQYEKWVQEKGQEEAERVFGLGAWSGRSYEFGGQVERTGLALVHRGETVLREGMSVGGGFTLVLNISEPILLEREESLNEFAQKIYGLIKSDQRLFFGDAYSG